jgi:hypothetical protein
MGIKFQASGVVKCYAQLLNIVEPGTAKKKS